MEEEIDRLLALQQFEENQRNQNLSDSDNPFVDVSSTSTWDILGSISPLHLAAPIITYRDNSEGESYNPSDYSPSTLGKPSSSTFGKYSDVESSVVEDCSGRGVFGFL